MLTIAVETCTPLIEGELWPLLEKHREELSTNKALMVLAPDIERYRRMEEAGVFVGLIARQDGRIVGYSGNFLSQHLHYRHLRCAENDVLFVDPAERGLVGLRLIVATERVMRERGAQIMLWHAKKGTTLEALLGLREEYRVQDIMFSRVL